MACPCCGAVTTDCCANPIPKRLFLTVDDQPSVAMDYVVGSVSPWCWKGTVPGCRFPCYTLCCSGGGWSLIGDDCEVPGTVCVIANAEGDPGFTVDCGPPFIFHLTCVTMTCCDGSCSILVTS